ncbi:hypothetical protein [Cohnella yongneupensis]|uniref:PsbP C-terminal domain-containing protein n=1 Tax=Cohnella yongneupensis TaxID=425006 RepID=A0ABW0QYP7_9BACL
MAKRSIIFALMVTLLLIAGCSNGSKMEWQTKDFGILTFDYPKDWVMPDNPDEQFYTFISREPYKPYLGVQDSVIMILGEKTEDAKDFIQRFYVDDGKIISESEELVGGYQAKRIETEKTEEAEEDQAIIHTIAYEVNTQSPLTVVVSIQYKDGYKDDVEIFEHLVKSIQFDPKKRQTL